MKGLHATLQAQPFEDGLGRALLCRVPKLVGGPRFFKASCLYSRLFRKLSRAFDGYQWGCGENYERSLGLSIPSWIKRK